MADLNYRTFSSLMATVKNSLHLFNENGLIKDTNYIKVARTINRELGQKIHQQKEEELEVENHRSFLPEDCRSIIAAAAIVGKEACAIDNHNFNLDIWARKKYVKFHSLSPTRRSFNKFSHSSYNLRCKSQYQIDVDDSELTFNFKEGKVLLAYTSELVDDKGNLLVLDHELVNPYYEAAITARILKDLWYNMDADTQLKYQNENDRVLPATKSTAHGIVNFPGYRKMKEWSKQKELEYYNKYVKIIM